MAPHVLGVGYSYDEYGITAAEWRKYGIEFDYVDDIGQAAAMLSFKEYICVAICTDIIPQEDLDALRKVRPVPIVVVPPSYSILRNIERILFKNKKLHRKASGSYVFV